LTKQVAALAQEKAQALADQAATAQQLEATRKEKGVLEQKQAARQGVVNVLKRVLAWVAFPLTLLLAGSSYGMQKLSKWVNARSAAKKDKSAESLKGKKVVVQETSAGSFIDFAETFGNSLFLPGLEAKLADKTVKAVKAVKPKTHKKKVVSENLTSTTKPTV
jgi:hypothetical protein